MTEWFLFLPQVRLEVGDIVDRAQVAEASGFDGVAFIDHLEAPGATHQGIWEAMTIATWVAARTERLRIGHLVLCDAFRHPAVLAKQAVTLSAASDGRFELGLGSGSWPQEFTRFGIDGGDDAAVRVDRFERNLALLRDHWSTDGDRAQLPPPRHDIPLVIGGTGRRTMGLVRRYADWWNIPSHRLDRLPELLPTIGRARASLQQMVGFVGRDADPAAVTARSTRLFGHLGSGLVCGDAAELVDHFAGLVAQGIERFYVWFSDSAAPQTISEFAETVMKTAQKGTI
ncbi:LLM class flavin-dependent oxidoreductase [Mycolicibacterium goodii]|uniref:LLM class flavin-dependent oxidoreductase n=1 Tax=Mycolicibacterium goodii TaxID=134601 RepID=UPI000C25A008|nr:LLM class flavin-dependent oxidoreductase [Mycolicibacterium goodii]MBU8810299.1 LLM class flavin-dependent oxidoreductase [Mycolicibacterium goodii]PJK20509.1 LLM class flavin-dependent oxidoreductase [Mycolicibacterium goodii]